MVAVSRLYVDANIYIRLFEGNDELSREPGRTCFHF